MILIYLIIGLVFGAQIVQSFSSAESEETTGRLIYNFPFHDRTAWGARDPVDIIPLQTPVPYVVIHDSGEPPAIEIAGCLTFAECVQSMKNIQDLHMDANGWWDIGYNFAIGGDGAAYEGRGWEILGAQAKYFNTVSIGICFIGEYNSKLPTLIQMNAINELIAAGVRMGYIKSDYRLVTHGQVRNTTCPGKKLIKKVITWPHYSNFPASPRDLLDVPEIPDRIKDAIRKELYNGSLSML